MEGTPDATIVHRLVILISEGLDMFRLKLGLIGIVSPGIQARDTYYN
jgi:hypothetical protein